MKKKNQKTPALMSVWPIRLYWINTLIADAKTKLECLVESCIEEVSIFLLVRVLFLDEHIVVSISARILLDNWDSADFLLVYLAVDFGFSFKRVLMGMRWLPLKQRSQNQNRQVIIHTSYPFRVLYVSHSVGLASPYNVKPQFSMLLCLLGQCQTGHIHWHHSSPIQTVSL